MQVATSSSSSPVEDQPLRLLLVRSRPGELPWLAGVIARTMGPVAIDEIIGFANAIWQLGNEEYDSVLLDVDLRDPEAIVYCREQIAEVAAVPVLNLREWVEDEAVAPAREQPVRVPEREPVGRQSKGSRRNLRVPWQRRSRRQPQAAREPEVASAG